MTDVREDRFIVRQARTQPMASLSSIQRHTGALQVSPVSRSTIARRLAEQGLHSRRPFRRLPLTVRHRRLRLQFCEERQTWTAEEWRRIVFSDESRFCVDTDDRRIRVWRTTGQRTNTNYTIERHTARIGGILVWGAISYDSRSPLIVIRGTLTAQRYVEEILQPHVLPFMLRSEHAFFQQDNACPHTAQVSHNCLRAVDTIPWPARSPDLSPIEHVWDQIGRQLQPSTGLQQLERQLLQLWDNLPQENIRRLYDSMPDRITGCIKARGGATRY